MEARTVFGGSAISKSMVAVVVAVMVALMLGATGGYLVKTLSLPSSSVAAPVLAGQPGASGFGSAWNYSTRRSGTQSAEGPAPTQLPLIAHEQAPDAQDRDDAYSRALAAEFNNQLEGLQPRP